ncbi:MAG: DJ-1/PfpI family protein [Alphaproteobacteria bacterium]|nr:DJ-1/PfpI family protein [Alphaproteobacteria bacterium]
MTSRADPSLAILVANGFDETQITILQRALTKDTIAYKIIAPEQGLVNGWQNNAWGHYFTVDEMISTAMGSDFDMLVLIGGERGIAKLQGNLHTRRIVNHFLEAGKPISAIGAGVSLLGLSPKSEGLAVAACPSVRNDAQTAQLRLSDQALVQTEKLVTSDGQDIEAWLEASLRMARALGAPADDARAA